MFCIDCGRPLAPDARFCSKCGAKIDEPGGSAVAHDGALAAGTAARAAATAPAPLAPPRKGIDLSQRLSPAAIVGGLLVGCLGIWLAARGPSTTAPSPAAAGTTAEAPPAPAAAAPPPPAPAPVRSYYALARGSPMCGSFKGAITAVAVMRSGNPTAIAMVLDRQGCEQAPQSYQFDVSNTLKQDLQAGVVLLTLADGTQVYTTSDSVSMHRD